jgi:lysyl-tRNA synthetase class 2
MAAGDPGADWVPTATFATLRARADLLERARAYFASTGALEVETPVLVRAPVTDVHLESLGVVDATDGSEVGFLQTSPEYAMKRLLCAGAPDIYQLCHVFRAGERGRRHNPEFTMLEWYRRGIDHHALMRDVEALVRALLEPRVRVGASACVTYRQAFERALGLDPLHAPGEELRVAIERRGVAVPHSMADAVESRDDLLDLAMGTIVAASFAPDRLTFLHDFPASQAALARIQGEVAARFEAFWGPTELANGFHELGSSAEQSARFDADVADRARRGRPPRTRDARFLAALRAGLPDCSGVALGFDRLVMVATGATRIDEVLAFPSERA